MLLDTSFYGFWEGLKKAVRIIGWHVASNLVVLAAAYLAAIHPSTTELEKYAVVAGAIALGNAVLGLIQKWLTSIRPDGIIVQGGIQPSGEPI